jgi:hypothetical protein
VDALVADIARAAEGWLAEQGHAADEPGEAPDDDAAQAVLQAASLDGTVATGAARGEAGPARAGLRRPRGADGVSVRRLRRLHAVGRSIFGERG